MSRVFLFVLDSVGIGGAPDAADYGDDGANTVGHIAEACARGAADEGRLGPLAVPNLNALGLGAALGYSSGSAALGDHGGAWAV
ncbi:MAG: phosphopentomutase, partial [Pseudomonadota bacterium]